MLALSTTCKMALLKNPTTTASTTSITAAIATSEGMEATDEATAAKSPEEKKTEFAQV